MPPYPQFFTTMIRFAYDSCPFVLRRTVEVAPDRCRILIPAWLAKMALQELTPAGEHPRRVDGVRIGIGYEEAIVIYRTDATMKRDTRNKHMCLHYINREQPHSRNPNINRCIASLMSNK